MRSTFARIVLAASLAVLTGRAERGFAEQGPNPNGEPQPGFRVESIEQKRTEVIAWLRVQVVADTPPQETWDVLQKLQEYPEFLDLFSRVTPVDRTETMTRYRMSVSPPWPIPDFDSKLWIAKLPAHRLMLWRNDKDDLTGSHGKVAVEEIPGGSRVIYEIHSPAKKAFPPWVVRIGLYLVLPGVAHDFYGRIRPQD